MDTTHLLESADVGRRVNRTAATVRWYARVGRLPVAVVTPRGTRLYRIEDVERLRRDLMQRTANELPG